MKSTYAKRNGHERYKTVKKLRGEIYKSRREKALGNLEEDLRTGLLRTAGERSDTPLNELQKERIKKEILNIKKKL